MEQQFVKKLFQCACHGKLQEIETLINSHRTDDGNNFWAVRLAKSNDTLAHVAARHGHLRLLEALYEKCGDGILESENFDCKRPLHEAAQASQPRCVQFLLSEKVDVNALKRADWTPLMLACTKPDLTIVKMLVEAGAFLHLRNKDGWTCFHIACREGHRDIVEFLHRRNNRWQDAVSKNGRTPLHTAALHGCVDIVQLLLQETVFDHDKGDNCGTTPFMDAIRAGHVNIARLLLKSDDQLARIDNVGRQAVHFAAESGMIESLRFLIAECKVDADSTTSSGMTPLHLARKEGHSEAVKLLLEFGAR